MVSRTLGKQGGAMILASVILLVFGLESLAVTLGDITVTLQSHRYYKKWDMTRFVYRVVSPSNGIPESWVLGVGHCLSDEDIDVWSSSDFTRVDDPIPGLQFNITRKRERFYLWLYGAWDVREIPIAVSFDASGGGDDLLLGALDGPACEGSSLSIQVESGSTVEFPSILNSGTYPGFSTTALLVSSSSSGWGLDYELSMTIPEDAQSSVVERIFQVDIPSYHAGAGETTIDVSYALTVSDDDFAGLPEGTYTIGIMYTVTSDY